MSPIDAIKTFAQTNPQSASLINGGVAVFAAAAIISSWGGKPEDTISAALIVLSVGMILVVLVHILQDIILMRTLTYFAVMVIVGWFVVAALHKAYPTNDSFRCMTYFWQGCKGTIDAATLENKAQLVSAGNLTIPDAKSAEVPGTSNVNRKEYQVFVQFAGVLTRDDIRDMMFKLLSLRWSVQGAASGGQRTAAAASYNEIRYSSPEDLPAAQILAAEVRANLSPVRQIGTKLNPQVSRGTLEVWISR